LNLKQGNSRLEIRKNFFTQRIVREWNKIPKEIKRAKNVAGFKSAYKNISSGPGGMPDAPSRGRY
jgi:hypothetical protein